MVFIGVVVIGLLTGWALRGNDVGQAAVGESAPDFSVRVIDGPIFTLSEHQARDGRPVVLNLWASWCVPCRREIPEISRFAERHEDVKVIGVAVDDTEESATAFARQIRASYDMALGDEAFEAAYPRIGLPVTYVIDGDGLVTDVFNGILDYETLVELVAS